MNSAAGKGVVDDSIFIDCRGRNVADQEALAGKITYFPASRALPIKYFPYLGQRNQVDKEVGYHSPLVAIQVDGPKWQQDWGLIGNNPGVGLRPRNTDARIDSQMFVLQGNDENIHPSDLDGEGDLNADYAVRVSKFLAAYEKTPAPAAGNGDHAFKGYEAFDPKVTLGNCGK